MLEAEGVQLPAILTLPEGQEVKWSIVLIPGSMASDVDGNYPSANMHPRMYADLARQLAQRGHAVLRYAKNGPDTGSIVVDEKKAEQPRQYMRDYDAIDPCTEIVKIPIPVLIVQGGLDQSGVIADNGEKLYQARYAAHPDTTSYAFFPDLQHFYKRATPAMNSQESMMLNGETDERVSNTISEWLDSLQ